MIPAASYNEIYMNTSLIIALFTLFHAFVLPFQDSKNINYANVIGFIVLVCIILLVGLRPISYRFEDMMTYNRIYVGYMNGAPMFTEDDILFNIFMYGCAKTISPQGFFFICALIYIYPMYRISKKLFNQFWFYSFFLLIVSFSFWSYATNGIRNGLATSVFLLAISYYDKKFWLFFLLLISTQIHKSLWLPVLAYTFTYFYSNPRIFLYGWILSIPLSLALGSFWESLFAGVIADDKLGGYLTESNSDAFKSSGFRFDFVIYSAGAVFVGWYFILKKNFNDILYNKLFNTYLMCNAFWILIIRANFSNRFAYLSWFLMAIIIIYPYLKKEFSNNHHIQLGKVFFIYFMFTFLMDYLYYQ